MNKQILEESRDYAHKCIYAHASHAAETAADAAAWAAKRADQHTYDEAAAYKYAEAVTCKYAEAAAWAAKRAVNSADVYAALNDAMDAAEVALLWTDEEVLEGDTV